MSEVTLELTSTPRSLNVVGGRGGMRSFHRAKKTLQEDLAKLLMASSLPRGCSRIVASAELRFPVRRRRDEGNHRVLLEKALGDALVKGGWLADDTPDFFRFTSVDFDPLTGPSRSLIRLRWDSSTGPRAHAAP